MKEPKLRFKGSDKGWVKAPLSDLAEISQGVMGDYKLNDGAYKLTRIETISNGKFNESKLGFTNEKPDDRFLLKKGDILFSNINSIKYIGNIAIFESDNEIYHGMNLLRIRATKINPYFLYYELNSPEHKKWSKSHANPAVSQASINQSTLAEQLIYYPEDLNEQMKVAEFLRDSDKQIELQEDKVDHLKNEKKAYLQKMFI